MLPCDCVVPAAGLSSRMGACKPLLPLSPLVPPSPLPGVVGTAGPSRTGDIAGAVGAVRTLGAADATETGDTVDATESGAPPMVVVAARNALAVCRRVIVVTGNRAEEVEDAVSRHMQAEIDEGRLLTVYNDSYASGGMISSIRRGAEAVETEYFFVAPADMPFLHADLFLHVWESRGAEGHKGAKHNEAGQGTMRPGPPIIGAEHPGGAVAAYFPIVEGRHGHPVLIARWVRAELAEHQLDVPMREFLSRYRTVRVPITDAAAVTDIDTAEAYRRLTAGW